MPRRKQRPPSPENNNARDEMSRRDFLRAAAVVGATLGAGNLLAGCGSQVISGSPTATVQDVTGGDLRMDDNNNRPTMPSEYQPAPTFTPQPQAEWVGRVVPTSTPSGPKALTWYCGACGQQFMSLAAYQQHALDTHTWRLPEIKRVDKPTYEQFIVGEIERFDEKNTAFSRRMWDEAYMKLTAETQTKPPRDPLAAIEGQALVAGAIYVDNKAGALHENYYGYNGHVRGAGGLYDWDEPVNPNRYPIVDPLAMTQRIKEVARIYGADLVGVTKLDQRWVYSHYFERATGKYGRLTVPFQYAIVMGVAMDAKMINESPGYEASATTALGYSRMAELSSSLAAYIRALGYPATPHGNDTAQSVPLAIDAGLGEHGRHGLLITPEYGTRQRLCKVFTNLPLAPDKPIDFGIQSFCETCHSCASACPVNAIMMGDRTTEITSISNRKGLLRWPVDTARCLLFWKENGVECSNCVAACPWSLHSRRDWLEL
jgi:ferredoxin